MHHDENTAGNSSSEESPLTQEPDVKPKQEFDPEVHKQEAVSCWVAIFISFIITLIGFAFFPLGDFLLVSFTWQIGFIVGFFAIIKLRNNHRRKMNAMAAPKATSGNGAPSVKAPQVDTGIPVYMVDDEVSGWWDRVTESQREAVQGIQEEAKVLSEMSKAGQLSPELKAEMDQIMGEHLITAVSAYLEFRSRDVQSLRLGIKPASDSFDNQIKILGDRVSEISEDAHVTDIGHLYNHENYLRSKFGRS